jgi:mannose-6-phosphate isomerase-like protein (cupin superfamily)
MAETAPGPHPGGRWTARAGQVVEDGTLRLEYTATAAETGGALHEMRARYAPGSAYPPAHLHPAQEERFVVEQGRLLFDVDGRERSVVVGEEIVIPRGAVHRVRNDGTEPAVAIWQTRPALRTGEFLARATEARTTGDLLELAAVVEAHADVYRLAVRPRRLSAGAVRVLAAVARLRARSRRVRTRAPA